MRKAAYVLILALTWMIPVERLDIEKLQPVESVAIYKEGGLIVLETDKESTGRGETVQQALTDLKENVPAVVYLKTADYLLVGKEAEEEAAILQNYLKASLKTATYPGGSVAEWTRYLKVHADPEKLY